MKNNITQTDEFKVVKDFDSRVAKLVGTDAAIVLNNILFWCDFNRANKRNYYDGLYWTFNTIEAFQKQFPWLSYHKIKRILLKLEKEGLIKVGNYNKHKYDRTKWYAVTRYMVQICTKHCADSPNPSCSSAPPIPDNNKDKKHTYLLKGDSDTPNGVSSPPSLEVSNGALSSKDQDELNPISSSWPKVSTGDSRVYKTPMSKRLLKLSKEAFDRVGYKPETEWMAEKAARVSDLFFREYEKTFNKPHDKRKNETLVAAIEELLDFMYNNDSGDDKPIPLDAYRGMIKRYFEIWTEKGNYPRFEMFCKFEVIYHRYREVWEGYWGPQE